MNTSCSNCSAIWTMEEIDEQQCAACGYPDHTDEDTEPEYDGSDDDYDRPNDYERAEMMHRIQRDLK